MRSRWLTSNEARTLSRRLRHYEYSPAFTRKVIEHLGHDPDTYYIIGADYRIPEPSKMRKHTHTSVAKRRVHQRQNRKRLVDVGRAAWRTPPAETK